MSVHEVKREWLGSQMAELQKRGVRKADIARKLGILPQSLNNILNGNREISDKFIDSLTEAYNLRPFGVVVTESERLKEFESRITRLEKLINDYGKQRTTD